MKTNSLTTLGFALTGAILGLTISGAFFLFQHDATRTQTAQPGWPVDHPLLCGLIVFAAILVIGRAYIFIRRMEA